MQVWKENVEEGRFLFHVIYCGPIQSGDFPARLSATVFNQILLELSGLEPIYRICAEGRVHGIRGTPVRGCMILGHQRPSREPGYYATVFDEGFHEARSYISLVPEGKNGPGKVELLTETGWIEIDAESASTAPEIRVVMAALREHLSWTDGKHIPRKKLRDDPATRPPTDPEYMRRVLGVGRRRMRITRAITALDRIAPFSLEFCLTLPHQQIRAFTQRILSGYRPELTVYWRGKVFVMSDDYYAFLGYRQAAIDAIPVAILGNFPKNAAKSIERGGIELLPPVQVTRTAVSEPAGPALEEWFSRQRLDSERRKAIPSDLAATWLVFADIIAHSTTTESDVHSYLLKFPPIIAAGGRAIESEVRLGTKYKMDLVVRSAGVTEDVLLIELENPQHNIFTRDGRPRKAVIHAKQQVEDWLRWVHEHPADAFVRTLGGVPPRGLVVIGKSRDLDDEQRHRLAHLNANSRVQIVTYDELLDRFGDLILQQCDDKRS